MNKDDICTLECVFLESVDSKNARILLPGNVQVIVPQKDLVKKD